MKPANIPVDDIAALRPVCLRCTIPEEYLDLNNHMDMRWYVALFDDAGDTLHDQLGLTRDFRRASGDCRRNPSSQLKVSHFKLRGTSASPFRQRMERKSQ